MGSDDALLLLVVWMIFTNCQNNYKVEHMNKNVDKIIRAINEQE